MTIISLAILVIDFGASRLTAGRPFSVKFIKTIFIFAIVAVFSLLIYYSYRQYVAWVSVEPSKFLLPPYQSIDYFIKYVGARLFAPYSISLVAALVFLYVAKTLNKKYEERFFEPEELWLGALALFLTGWPGSLFYLISLIFLYLIIHIFITFYNKLFFRINPREVRVGLRFWWLPLAIFVIIINKWLINLGAWKLLKI